MLHLLWLVPLLPLAGFVAADAARPAPRRTARGRHRRRLRRPRGARRHRSSRSSFIVSPPAGHAFHQVLWTWFDVGGLAPAGRLLPRPAGGHASSWSSPSSASSSTSTRPSTWSDDEGYTRFFTYMNLFVGLDAGPGAGRQPAAALPRLGGRRPVQLPADRLLVQGPAQRLRGPQGVHRHPRRRHRPDRRPVPAVHAARHAADPAAAWHAAQRRPGRRARPWPSPPPCCCSAAPSASRRSCRCRPGCRTPWPAPRRSAP